MKKYFLLLFILIGMRPIVHRGIVVAASDRYMQYLLPSIAHLRENLHCALPIEVWHSGDELSCSSMNALEKFHVKFRDIAKILYADPAKYRGFQIKPWIIYLSSFDEVILMDADAFFYEDPSVLFTHHGYKKTGAFFFRDRGHWVYPKNDSYQCCNYEKRRSFIRSLIPSPSHYLPSDWNLFWTDKLPSEESPFLNHYIESGCIALRKRDHIAALRNIIQLNENAKNTYQYVYGDKETFWIGFEMAKEPYYVNQRRACELRGPDHSFLIYMVHFLDNGRLFYSQKRPIQPEVNTYFWDEYPNHDLFEKPTTEEERSKILQTYEVFHSYAQ